MMQRETLGPVLARGSFETRREAIAIDCDGQLISYGELAAAAHVIATAIDRQGIAPKSHIGILAGQTGLIVAAMLATMARGFVFAVLEPGQPAHILKGKADAADLRCLIVEPTLLAEARNSLAELPTIFVESEIFTKEADGSASTFVGDLAAATGLPLYLYFTSGTAGPAKPILGRSDSLLHFLNWEIGTFGLDKTVRAAQLTPPHHDPFLRDVFVPLVTSGTICVPRSRQIVLSPIGLARWLDSADVDLVHCTPTVFRNLCNAPLNDTLFPRLKCVLIAGEQLRGAHVRRWFEVFGDRVRLVNLYGPTETTLAKLFYRISRSDGDRSIIPIGLPMEGAEARIMATETEEADPEEPGELVIVTRFSSFGYFRRPDLNLPVFGSDPSSAPDSPVRYRTGDIVRRLPEGMIEFIGRRDRQDKIRGKRIDLGEVEDALLVYAPVQSVVATVLTEGGGKRPDRLAAFYVADVELNEPSIKERLSRELPSLMVPDVWIRVNSLPTNSNGKIDIDGLATHLMTQDGAADMGTIESDEDIPELADKLLAIWKEILRNDAVGLEDTFMEAGGDSLSIMLLIARLDEEFGYELSLWEVFDDLTITKLCVLMQPEMV
ncbi:non-ribosomal peptide synthetase [Mesorhizobium sp. CO1-1-8]|uniref:non-ribosomal peptide synthetase n=1 Tax=Mesorhizobium sp. CO1-1-8 TaxID=2876631 RepID=UPI001CD0B474|nr:non-ribosomal peptide synthetase [Mesorhizobium sp. CO1-1-8]MBZ9770989.1 non-ribosomal peptide synthetase [Mesorhizobium sp. CO1-1-8]